MEVGGVHLVHPHLGGQVLQHGHQVQHEAVAGVQSFVRLAVCRVEKHTKKPEKQQTQSEHVNFAGSQPFTIFYLIPVKV